MRRTHTLRQVARILVDNPYEQHWGYDLSKKSTVRSGALYPILSRLLGYGWLSDGWEDRTTITDKRPPRRYYKLTDTGYIELSKILEEK